MLKNLTLICLINFLIAALMGLAMRYNFINPIGVNYRFLTHAHSHIAMLGWVYLMLFTFIIHYFIPDKKPIYNRLFWLTEFSVIGMMVSFPIQGYALISISFSTLHIFCSYYFVYLIFKNLKTKSIVTNNLIRASLLFMLISTIGVWCLGPAVSMLGQASTFYQIAIQFFLHFQFNGWFLIAVVALFFHLLNIKNSNLFQKFFKLLIISTILTFALPVYWFLPYKVLLWINGFGVILQSVALFQFLKLIKPELPSILKQHSTLTIHIFNFAIFCFSLKIGVQLLSLIPKISKVAFQHHNIVIGFIHLTMLGVITGFLFSYILRTQLVSQNKVLSFGIYSFILGFILTETLLIVQGSSFYFGSGLIPNYYLLLFIASCLLPLGILCIAYNIYQTPRKV
jgi:hypothetical protein